MDNYPNIGSMIEGYNYDGPITFNDCGWIASGQFPSECISDCSASGDVTESTAST